MKDELFVFSSKLDAEFLKSIYEDDQEHAAIIFEQFLGSVV
jgi:hypothetical protein